MNDTVPPDIDGNPSAQQPKTHGLLGRLVNRHTSPPSPVNDGPAAVPGAGANVPDSDNTAAEAFATRNTNDDNLSATRNNAVSGNGNSALPVPGRANTLAVGEKILPRQESASVISTLSAQLGPASPSQEEKPRSDLSQGPKKPNGNHADKSPNNDGNDNDNDCNTSENGDQGANRNKRTFMQELHRSFWLVVKHSWMNILLVFVPIGIIVANVGINARVVFAINCVAIIPLAGLLSFATESVARKMGDALGALLNVTFGNAVELIIFIIALAKNQIRIVQASLLGSILANLLLILGMGFFLGGLRFREQVSRNWLLYSAYSC